MIALLQIITTLEDKLAIPEDQRVNARSHQGGHHLLSSKDGDWESLWELRLGEGPRGRIEMQEPEKPASRSDREARGRRMFQVDEG